MWGPLGGLFAQGPEQVAGGPGDAEKWWLGAGMLGLLTALAAFIRTVLSGGGSFLSKRAAVRLQEDAQNAKAKLDQQEQLFKQFQDTIHALAEQLDKAAPKIETLTRENAACEARCQFLSEKLKDLEVRVKAQSERIADLEANRRNPRRTRPGGDAT